MLKRKLYTVVFLAMLAVAATIVSSTEAQAMGAGCCCPAEECGCGCTQHGQEEAVLAFATPGTVDAGTCSCSTGPGPFRTDDAAPVVCLDPLKKRFFQNSAAAAAPLRFVPASLTVKRYKPPAFTCQPLYILKSSFLI